jgi:hypothetical protein
MIVELGTSVETDLPQPLHLIRIPLSPLALDFSKLSD